MTKDEWTPYDNPKSLLDRIMFPSMRFAYLQGLEVGKWGEDVDSEIRRVRLSSPRYVKKNPKDLDPEDVPPIEPMRPDQYEYRKW